MTQISSIGRKTAVLFVFILLLLVLAIRGSVVGAAEQEDVKAPNVVTTTLDIQFSSDGTTFSDNLSANQGDTVWVRINYDNTGDEQGTGVAAALTLPTGFTLVSSSTTTCLTPSGAETVCNSDAGMGGAITEGTVWTGQVLGIAPQAGLYAEAVDATSGILEFGKKRYFNMEECQYSNLQPAPDRLYSSDGDNTGTNMSNTAVVAATCAATNSFGYTHVDDAVAAIDLLGQRYLNYHECKYVNGNDFIYVNAQGIGGTNTANAAAGALVCAGTAGGHTLDAAGSSFTTLDLSGNRYLNLNECNFAVDATPDNIMLNAWTAIAGSNASNIVDGTAVCAANAGSHVLNGSTVLNLDTLDAARGAGYIEFPYS